MKKTYVRPTAVAETFVANNYCKVCGKTSDGIYHFKCDAAGGPLYYYPNGTGGEATYIGSYSPCGKTHDTADRSNFYEGFVDTKQITGYFWGIPQYDYNGVEDDGEHVLVWRGDNGRNGHATVSISMGEIDEVRS